MKTFLRKFCDFFLTHYMVSGLLSLAVIAVSFYLSFQIKINSNQLDLLPQDIPTIQEAKRVTDMIGGTGFVILTLKFSEKSEADKMIEEATLLKLSSKDEKAEALLKLANALYEKPEVAQKNLEDAKLLKGASDELYDELIKLKEVQYGRHKFSLDFLRNRLMYFLETPDLEEVFRQLNDKREDLVTRSSPFFMDVGAPPVEVDLKAIQKKYNRVGKKEIDDDYYISPDKRMLVIVLKPSFSMNQIDSSRNFIQKIKDIVAEKKFAQRGLEVGFTGSYVQYVDAYDSIIKSLQPVTLLSFGAIAGLLLFFMRKKRLITVMLSSLIYSVVIIFGVTYMVIGELNIITSVIGGILAGMGIDYGIHLIHRFREEYLRLKDLKLALVESMVQIFPAALYSAATTAGAFVVLGVSEFKGFSEFGWIAAYGTLITAGGMFFLTGIQLMILGKFWPGFMNGLDQEVKQGQYLNWLYELPFGKKGKIVLSASTALILASLASLPFVGFDHDSRNMIETHITSEILMEEMHLRYEVAGDPLAVATNTLDEAFALWDHLEPMTPERAEIIAQVVSPFSFAPPYYRQQKNHELMQKFKKDSAEIKEAMVPTEHRENYAKFQKMLEEKPFTLNAIPPEILSQFKSLPSSKHQGWLTFIYPKVDKLYFASDLKHLDDLIGQIHYPLIGRQSLDVFRWHVPQWEKRMGADWQTLSGESIYDMPMDEVKKALWIINHASEKELQSFDLFPMVREEILKSRPFHSVTDLQKTTKTAVTTGSTLMVANFTYIVQKEARFIFIGSFILVIGILFLSFRRLAPTFLVLLPLVTGALFTGLFMALTGVRINYFNISVLPVILGYGIDSSIFIFLRYMETRSVREAISKTAVPIVASSLTTLAAWGALSIAVHPGLRSMGLVAIIGIGTTIAATLILFPAFLERVYGQKEQPLSQKEKEQERPPHREASL